MRLKDQRVVVIGASGGMGLATAEAAAAEGARVVIASRSAEKLEQARARIHGDVEAITLDIVNEDEVRGFFARIGALDHLVVTTVARASGNILDLDMPKARLVFETKFWGSLNAIRYALPDLSRTGSITLFSGVGAWNPLPGGSIGAAVNGAVVALCRGLAVDLAPIRVNAVSPGLIVTPTWDDVPTETRHEYFDRFARVLPAGRPGQADEVAEGVVYLMCNAYTTGTVLQVEGGYRLIPAISLPYPWRGDGVRPTSPAATLGDEG